MSTTQLTLPAADPTVRSFFEIDSKHGRRIIAERQILLDGVVNFRDLGGYRTTNGSYDALGNDLSLRKAK
jgi:protein-tyrosine phosphatase